MTTRTVRNHAVGSTISTRAFREEFVTTLAIRSYHLSASRRQSNTGPLRVIAPGEPLASRVTLSVMVMGVEKVIVVADGQDSVTVPPLPAFAMSVWSAAFVVGQPTTVAACARGAVPATKPETRSAPMQLMAVMTIRGLRVVFTWSSRTGLFGCHDGPDGPSAGE